MMLGRCRLYVALGGSGGGGGKLASLLLFLPYPFLPFPSLSPLRLCHGKTFSLLWESMEIQLWLILSERKKGNGRDERKTEKVGRERGLARKEVRKRD